MNTTFNLFNTAVKSAWRNLKKHNSFNLLNILGLSLTFATIALIISYLYREHTFESFHENRDRIYRPTFISGTNDYKVHWARLPINYINHLPDEIPEIRQLIRFQNQEQKYIRVGEERFKPKHAYTTDAGVFTVFSFKLISGDPFTALKNPRSVVLTASEAQKLFGKTDVIGEELIVTGDWTAEEQIYTVSGIMKDIPSNTHLPVDMLFSFTNEEERSGWAYVYILLQDNALISQVENKIDAFIGKYESEENKDKVDIQFQPLTDIHLKSQLAREIQLNGYAIYLRIFAWVGLFIWLIGIVNFSNLNLALTLSRSREVGVRKVLGASRSQFTFQFIGEALFYSTCGLIAGITLAYLLLPFFQTWTGVDSFPPLVYFLPTMAIIAIITAFLTAVFPVILTSSIMAIQALKNSSQFSVPGAARKVNMRKVLMTIQFVAVMILVSTTIITYQQYKFVSRKNPGFQSEQIIAIPSVPDVAVKNYPLFKRQILQIPGVRSVSACMEVPSREIRDTGPVLIKGQQQDPKLAPQVNIQVIDPDFTEMMGLELLAGEGLHQQKGLWQVPEFTDQLTPADYLAGIPRQYLLNETAIHQLGWTNPQDAIGKEINFSIGSFILAYGQVTGVVRDYHQESLRNKIDPLIMVVEPVWLQTFLIKVSTEQLEQTVNHIKKVWNSLFPYALEFHFLDALFDNLYRQDQVQVRLLGMLSLLAIIISIIGLVGLLSFSLKKRAKELAIRRVVGAGQISLTRLMGKEYLMVFLLAAVIAIPASYYGANKWLDNFAYRISIHPLIYLGTILLLSALLMIIIYWQTLKAIRNNPVLYLRDE